MNEVEAGGYSSLTIDGSGWKKAGGTWGTGTSVLERVRGRKNMGFGVFVFIADNSGFCLRERQRRAHGGCIESDGFFMEENSVHTGLLEIRLRRSVAGHSKVWNFFSKG